MAWLSIQMLGLAVSMGALVVGTHLGALCAPLVPPLPTPTAPSTPPAPSAILQASHRPSRWSSWILVDTGSAGGSLSDVDTDPAPAPRLAGEPSASVAADGAADDGSASKFAPAEDDGAGNIELGAKAASEAPTVTTTAASTGTPTSAPARKPSAAAVAGPPSVTIKVVHPTGSPWAVLSKRERMSVVTTLLVTAMLVAVAVTVSEAPTSARSAGVAANVVTVEVCELAGSFAW